MILHEIGTGLKYFADILWILQGLLTAGLLACLVAEGLKALVRRWLGRGGEKSRPRTPSGIRSAGAEGPDIDVDVSPGHHERAHGPHEPTHDLHEPGLHL